MSDVTDTAMLAAVLHLVGGAFGSAASTEKVTVRDAMRGRGTLFVTLPDGTEIARVVVPKAATTVVVTNEHVLLDWVQEFYPTEIETKTVVRSAFLERIRIAAKTAGILIGPGGEADIPGLELREVPPEGARITGTRKGRELAQRLVDEAKRDAVAHLSRVQLPGGAE